MAAAHRRTSISQGTVSQYQTSTLMQCNKYAVEAVHPKQSFLDGPPHEAQLLTRKELSPRVMVEQRVSIQHVGQTLGAQLQGSIRAIGGACQSVHRFLGESLSQGSHSCLGSIAGVPGD